MVWGAAQLESAASSQFAVEWSHDRPRGTPARTLTDGSNATLFSGVELSNSRRRVVEEEVVHGTSPKKKLTYVFQMPFSPSRCRQASIESVMDFL